MALFTMGPYSASHGGVLLYTPINTGFPGASRKMKITDWIMLILLSMLWGGSFFFNAIALQDLPVLWIVTLRVGLAAAVLWIVAAAAGIAVPRSRQLWTWFLIMGLINNVLPFTLIVWGQTAITAGLASILNATTPFFGVVLAVLTFGDENVTRNKVVGVVVGFVGVAIMIGPDVLADLGQNVVAQFAVLTAAFLYAVAGIFGRRFHAAGVAPLVASAGQVTMSALILLPIVLFVDGPIPLNNVGVDTWMSVAALALLSTALAYILYFRLLRSAGPINLMLVTLLIPVSAIVLGVFLLGETIRPIEIVGMSVIALALIIIDGRLTQRLSLRG